MKALLALNSLVLKQASPQVRQLLLLALCTCSWLLGAGTAAGVFLAGSV